MAIVILTGLRYFIMLGSSPISSKTKKQPIVAQSSAEVEYKALADVTSKLLWLKCLLHILASHMASQCPYFMIINLPSTLRYSSLHECTKHIKVDCHFICKNFQQGVIAPHHISITSQLADIFTKGLDDGNLIHQIKLGILDLHAPT